MGKKRIVTQAGTEIEKTANQNGGVKSVSKSKKLQISKARANIRSSYNNIMVTLSDQQGQVLLWSSAGKLGFKGSRKSTPYAATMVAKDLMERAQKFNLTELEIIVRGIGPGRDAAIRGLANSGPNVTSIVDDTPLPHNGVRAPKPRRV